MIGKRRTRWIKLADAVRFAEEVSGPQAVLEDQWEYLVSQQLRSEKGSDVERPQDVSETYLWSSTLEKLWAEHKLDITWDDWTARGEGLYSLLKAERALAEKEGDTPRHQLFGSAPTLAETEAILASSGTPQQPANSMNIVESTRHAPTLGTRRAAAKTHGFVEGETHHFFATPVWADIVDGDRVRLLKWMRSTPKWDWKYVSFISTRDRRLLGPENPSGTLGNRQVPRPNSNFKDRRA